MPRNGSESMVAELAENSFKNREVTEEEVRTAVLKYAETKQAEGSRQFATTLKTAEIRFSANQVTLMINNETQREQFLNLKQNFVDVLRAELQNSMITADVMISEHQAQVKAYKPIDIFKAMSEKNPALLELKKRFDLEIDY